MSARILDVTPATYHADPLEAPSLSASIAHTLLSRSPAHAWLEHPRLGGVGKEVTPNMDEGSLLHRLVLKAGAAVEVIEAPDWRTNDAKDARDAARRDGKIPALRKDFEAGAAIACTWVEKLAALGIQLSGRSEVAIAWEEESSLGLVPCRAMLDHLVLDVGRGRIYDLKSTKDASLKAVSRRAIDMGHDVQAAAYTSAVAALHPELAGRLDFVFLYCETSAPHCVTPARPDGIMRELGASKWARAVETWARCFDTGIWPGYVTGIVPLETPPWALSGEQMLDAAD